MSPWRIAEIFFLHLASASHAVDFGTRKPGTPHIRSITQMATGFRYTLALPALDPVDSDVATRELSINVAGVTTTVTGTPADATLQFEAREGAHVLVTLTDIDLSLNRSEASDPLEFDATDTVPPHRPGSLSVTGVDQISLPDVAPPDAGPTP